MRMFLVWWLRSSSKKGNGTLTFPILKQPLIFAPMKRQLFNCQVSLLFQFGSVILTQLSYSLSLQVELRAQVEMILWLKD